MTPFELHQKYVRTAKTELANQVGWFINACALHLRRGDDIDPAAGHNLFRDGKRHDKGAYGERQFMRFSLLQLENVHPWIRCSELMKNSNYFHLSTPVLYNPYLKFDDNGAHVNPERAILSMVPVKDEWALHREWPPVDVIITEELVAAHTSVQVSVIFST